MKSTSRSVSSLGEFGLINHLTKQLPIDRSVACGVGDDCAVIQKNRNTYQLLTTDMSIEGVHFDHKKVKPAEIGYKACARSISDIAAMGGIPRYAVVAFAIPKTLPVRYVNDLFKGIKKCASLFSVSIVGGDTSQSKNIMIAISVVGDVEKKRLVLRRGARVGDGIYVTGTLGGSIIKKHVSFKPRVHEARFLTHHASIHAMIDISDGLVQDLGHILKSSGVGCVIEEPTVPVSRDALRITRHDRHTALQHALYDGEDFELVFTAAPTTGVRLQKKWSRKFRIPLTRIGTIMSKRGIFIRSKKGTGKKNYKKDKGYTHF
ncbi:MAG: thiamine-phosphate kinase [Candidatus Omnitrophica bacterium]|nr:thiamine-phosphate kinase [Candidatus Omnitrophota bacterium]